MPRTSDLGCTYFEACTKQVLKFFKIKIIKFTLTIIWQCDKIYLSYIIEKIRKIFMKHVDIYTDGACRGNPGKGGWGAILVYGGREKELSGGEPMTTNNRMELMAAIAALEALKEPCEITLTSDSKYLTDAINKGWLESWKKNGWRKADKSAVLNVELWQRIDGLLKKHDVTFVWVHGHAGHEYNERCDLLATAFADSL